MKSRLRKPEPENLQLQSFAPDDPALPKPLGFRRTNRRKQDKCEAAKLAATKRFGGLLPVQLGPQFWQCARCRAIHRTRAHAMGCCKVRANRIQTCANGHRLPDCTCPKRRRS
jgi:hypothetical protein